MHRLASLGIIEGASQKRKGEISVRRKRRYDDRKEPAIGGNKREGRCYRRSSRAMDAALYDSRRKKGIGAKKSFSAIKQQQPPWL